MYVRILSSWLQLVYILWLFYVSIFSICHKFIDSIISGGLIPSHLFYCLQGNNNKRFVPRVNKAHWVNPYKFILAVCKAIISIELAQGSLSTIGLIPSHFYWMQGKNIKRVGPRGTKSHWVNPWQFLFTGSKAIISIESSQVELWPIGLISSKFFTGCKAIITRDSAQGELRPIGLIPIDYLTIWKAIISIELSLGALRTIGLIPSNLF